MCARWGVGVLAAPTATVQAPTVRPDLIRISLRAACPAGCRNRRSTTGNNGSFHSYRPVPDLPRLTPRHPTPTREVDASKIKPHEII
jgi:hypothetical protein